MGSASFPALGQEVPRSGGALTRFAGRVTLRALGFRFEGELPNLRKFVIIAAPHTSNWDFVVAMGAKLSLGLFASWLAKDTLFWFPFGAWLRALGGIPVDRRSPNDVVAQMAAEFGRRDRLVLGIAPEGTRRHVERWKTGFWHVAHAAGVPIVPVALDWERRTVRILAPFTTSGDTARDIEALRSLYRGVRGRSR